MSLDAAATLAAVDVMLARARGGGLSFATADAADADVDALLHEACAPEPDAPRPRLAAACDALAAFLSRVEEDVSHLAVSRADGVATWVRWGGGADTVVTGVLSVDAGVAHAERVHAQASRRLDRLRWLAVTASAAARVAVVIAGGGGPLAALPIAFQLVRAANRGFDDG